MFDVQITLRLFLIVLVSQACTSALALSCMAIPDNEAGFQTQFDRSGYVVLATPVLRGDDPQGRHVFDLKVSKSWKQSVPGSLSVAYAMPDGVWTTSTGRPTPGEEQIYFLRHGKNETINGTCDRRVFPVSAGQIDVLDELGDDYRVIARRRALSTEGVVCLSPQLSEQDEQVFRKPDSVRIDGSSPVARSIFMPLPLGGLDMDQEHMLEVMRRGTRTASFKFRFKDRGNTLCLLGSETIWRLDEGNCGCL